MLDGNILLHQNDSLRVCNPSRFITDSTNNEQVLWNRMHSWKIIMWMAAGTMYILWRIVLSGREICRSCFIRLYRCRRNKQNAFVSLILSWWIHCHKIQVMMSKDTAYKKGAEYGICIDGNGRLIALTDYIKGLNRPDPNDKAGFNKVIIGDMVLYLNPYWESRSAISIYSGWIRVLLTLNHCLFSYCFAIKLELDAFAAEGFPRSSTITEARKFRNIMLKKAMDR